MKKFLCLTLSMVFVFGVLFPVSRTSEGKSPFIQHIKQLFHFSPDYEREAKAKKGPIITDEGGSRLFQQVRNVFHYFPEEKEKPKEKKYPLKFDKFLKKGPQKEEIK